MNLDIYRSNSHLTFGKGHALLPRCEPGASRGRVALDELLSRFPEWDVDYGTARLAPTSTVRGWEKLRIVLS